VSRLYEALRRAEAGIESPKTDPGDDAAQPAQNPSVFDFPRETDRNSERPANLLTVPPAPVAPRPSAEVPEAARQSRLTEPAADEPKRPTSNGPVAAEVRPSAVERPDLLVPASEPDNVGFADSHGKEECPYCGAPVDPQRSSRLAQLSSRLRKLPRYECHNCGRRFQLPRYRMSSGAHPEPPPSLVGFLSPEDNRSFQDLIVEMAHDEREQRQRSADPKSRGPRAPGGRES
jgi:hypothetical protein